MDFKSLMLSLLMGLKTTVLTFVFVMAVSLPLGYIFTFLATSKNKAIKMLAECYIYIIRGTPLLLQLLFIYLGLPFIPVIGDFLKMDRMTAALVGFILNYSAYFAEIFRGGLLSIDKGQYEAAQVLGLTKLQTLFHIINPQMLKVVLPSLTNEAVTLVKDTSLLYAVAVPELLHYTKTAVSRTANPSVFIITAVIYLIINSILTLFLKNAEKQLAK